MRFSIRTLLLVTTLVATACYWFIRPSQIAARFVHAIESNNFAAADACFLDPAALNLKPLCDKSWRFRASAELVPYTIQDILHGRRRIGLFLAHGEAGPMRIRSYTVIATQRGLLTPEIVGGVISGISI